MKNNKKYEGSFMEIEKDEEEVYIKSVDEFKKLLFEMRDGIPKWKFFGMIENLIPDKRIRDYFLNNDVFVKLSEEEKFGNKGVYFLGVNGMILANNFKMEELSNETKNLTRSIKILTWLLILLNGLMLLGLLIQVF